MKYSKGQHQTTAPFKCLPFYITSRISYLSQYLTLARRPKETHMYDTIREKLYWPHRGIDVYTLEWECRSCTQNVSQMTNKRNFQLFLATGLPKFVAINILGPLPMTTTRKQNIFIISNLFPKFTCDPYSQNQFNANSDNSIEQLCHATWDTFILIDSKWAPISWAIFLQLSAFFSG